MELTREGDPDADGWQSYAGPVTWTSKGPQVVNPWNIGVRSEDVIVLMGNRANTCIGGFDSLGRINARCTSMGSFDLGTIRMTRVGEPAH